MCELGPHTKTGDNPGEVTAFDDTQGFLKEDKVQWMLHWTTTA